MSNTMNPFDFDELSSLLNSSLVKVNFTESLIETIRQLAFLYSLSSIEMSKVVQASLELDGFINEDKLRNVAREYYKFAVTNSTQGIVDQKERERNIEDEPKTKEEEIRVYFETTSPRQMLKDLASGAEPAISDLQIVEQIIFKQKLSPGVVNVLLHSLLISSDFKLNKNHIEKIASHWSRKQVKTAKEAMELAKKEREHLVSLTNNKPAKNYQEVPNGKLLSLFLADSSHHQLTRLTQILGFQKDDETIAQLLNEAYQKYK
ncbi:MAG TPA: DnaD domain protein [Pseudoneobacillus sp.]|nr:DnaD domain protein [Pseudoneobacillus sp.]